MKIHVIQTGSVRVRRAQVRGQGHGLRRRLAPMLGGEWTEPLPILAYAIEHPEGVIVVDTGETARTAEPGYFPAWHPYYRRALRLAVRPEDEIGPRLTALGLRAGDVRQVVMTHLHTDHAGGLHHFPGCEIVVDRSELAAASGLAGRAAGYLNRRWPAWFEPRATDLPARPYGAFARSLPLTRAGDVLAVALPGHTPGHLGVVVEDGDHRVLIAGDASYSLDLMLEGVIDGVSPDERPARQTLASIRRFVTESPTVYAVAHDPETAARVQDRIAVPA